MRRDPATLSPAAARFASLPAGHPQGYADCFDAFVADVYDGDPRRHAAGRDCRPSPTACAPRAITDAVLASAREERWVDVAASRATPAVAT